MTPEIVRITQEIAERWYGKPPPYRLRGYAVVLGDEILGIAGSYIYGSVTKKTRFLFAEIKPEARKYRKYILRVAKILMSEYNGRELYAVAQEGVCGATRLLEHIGFTSINGYLYRRAA